jgi:hypothetical protein
MALPLDPLTVQPEPVNAIKAGSAVYLCAGIV